MNMGDYTDTKRMHSGFSGGGSGSGNGGLFDAQEIHAYDPDQTSFTYGASNPSLDEQHGRIQQQENQAGINQGNLQDQANHYGQLGQQWGGGAAQAYQGDQYGSRDQQMQAYARMLDMADKGPGPSAAQAQLAAGQDANMQQQLAMARSGRGPGASGAAIRNAQFQGAQMAQQTNQQAAVLRAQEAANWRTQQAQLYGAAGTLASNQRGQDLGAGQGQAQLALGYGGLQGQANQTALGYGQQQQGYEQLYQQTNLAQQGASADYERLKSGNEMTAAGYNAQARQDNNNATLSMIGTGIAAAAPIIAASDVNAKMDIQPVNASPYDMNDIADPWGPSATGAKSPSGQGDRWSKALGEVGSSLKNIGKEPHHQFVDITTGRPVASDVRLKENVAPAPMQKGMRGGADAANSRARVPILSHVVDGLTARGGPVTPEEERARTQQGYALGRMLGHTPPSWTEGQIADQKKQRGVAGQPYGPPPPTDFRGSPGYTYDYKPDAQAAGAPPGRQFGPMAQDLEHVPGVVRRDPNTGYETVDTGRLALANTAALSEDQKRIDALEAMLARPRMTEAIGY